MRYSVVNGECEVVENFNQRFTPYAPADEAEYRGTTYIGGGKNLFSDGVEVEIYDTPNNDDDPDGMNN